MNRRGFLAGSLGLGLGRRRVFAAAGGLARGASLPLRDVRAAFERVRAQAEELRIDRKGHELPKGGHFQGVQILPGSPNRAMLTSSSDARAYLVVSRLTPSDGCEGRVESVTTLALDPLRHAGGFQEVGGYLAIGVEDDLARTRSEVVFVDVATDPLRPRVLSEETIRRSGGREVSTAGAVGIVARPDGGMVLAVATWDAATIDFYRAARNPLTTTTATFEPWRTWRRDEADEAGWVDGSYGSYQSVNLVSQSDGAVFLVGFSRSDGEDWMDLYSVDLDSGPPARSMLRKVARKHMSCRGGASFQAAAGLHVVGPGRFEVYAARGTSGDHVTGTTITLNRFRADRAGLSEVPPT